MRLEAACAGAWEAPTAVPCAHVQTACAAGGLVALPAADNAAAVQVLQLPSPSSSPCTSPSAQAAPVTRAKLIGHRRAVCALAFTHSPLDPQLVSASTDSVYLWDVDTGIGAPLLHDADAPGDVQALAIRPDDRQFALACGAEVLVASLPEGELGIRLESSSGLVQALAYLPPRPQLVVTLNEDRTFKIWDLAAQQLLYQSAILGSTALLSVAAAESEPRFAVGNADGIVRFFDVAGHDVRQAADIPTAAALAKFRHLQVRSTIGRAPRAPGTVVISDKRSSRIPVDLPPARDDVAESGETILSMAFVHLPQRRPRPAASIGPAVPAVLTEDVPGLLVAQPTGLALFNTRTFQPLCVWDFDGHFAGSCTQACATSPTGLGLHAVCVVGAAFERHAKLLRIAFEPPPGAAAAAVPAAAAGGAAVDVPPTRRIARGEGGGLAPPGTLPHIPEPEAGAAAGSADGELSMLSAVPLAPDSLLHASLQPKEPKVQSKKPSTGPRKVVPPIRSSKPSTVVRNDPITFGRKIRSSGYGSEAPRKMFQPKTVYGRGSGSAARRSSSASRDASGLSRRPLGDEEQKRYPVDAPPPSVIQHAKALVPASKSWGVSRVALTRDGRHLAAALTDRTVPLLRVTQKELKEGKSLVGHEGAVVSLDWSMESRWLLSASDDNTVRIWDPSKGEYAMMFANSQHNFKTQRERDPPNTPLKNVRGAQFYYMDKFVLVAAGSELNVYKYFIDTTVDDIRRYVSNSRYRLVTALAHPGAQSITCMAAPNSFYSYLVLTAGSDRSLGVFDMNVGKSVRTIANAQSRAVHNICLNTGSAYAAHAAEAYDLFLTAAVGDGIALWDLRSNRQVRRFSDHTSRAIPTGMCFSPCGRFIASGSEDRCAYIYDIRAGTYLQKLTGHTDVVSDVIFHPLRSQVMTASMDGQVRTFA